MKGTVPRPVRPARAAGTAAHSTSNEPQEEPPVNPENRITLAVLDENERSRGYDPYNATAVRGPADVWSNKPKRD